MKLRGNRETIQSLVQYERYSMTDKFNYIADTLPKEYLDVIGDIVVRWGRSQWQLAKLIAIGFDIPKETGRAFTNSMSVKSLCDVLLALVHTDRWFKDDNMRTSISALSKDVMSTVEHRNIFAHGAFIFDLDAPNDFQRILSKKKKDVFPISTENITLDQLNQLIEEVRSL